MATPSALQPNDVIFFDVDGVLTNLTQEIINNDLLLLLVELIKNNFIVVLNSGRSMSWLSHAVLEPLDNFSSQIQNLDFTNFFVIGEKGGAWLDFNHKTSLKNQDVLFDKAAIIPSQLTLLVENLVKSKFNETMFMDLTKQTILTLERRPTASIADFQFSQKNIVLELERLLRKLKLSSTFEIDLTTIAIDVQNVVLGKGYGVRKVLDWLNEHKAVVKHFFTIGDSSSDFEMPETLARMGKTVLHVHVGEISVPSELSYPVLTTYQKYSLGTKEFLNNSIIKIEP